MDERRKSVIPAILVAAMSLTTGGGLGIVALDILLDHSQGNSPADRVWGQSAALAGLLLGVAGINTLLTVILHNRIARLFAIVTYLATIGAAVWGVSAGLDLLCVRQQASIPSPRGVLTARISIAASAISGWIGLMGLLAASSLRRPESNPVPEKRHE